MEFLKRAKLAFSDFMTGQYDRLDIVIYQVHLQSLVFKFTGPLPRGDIKMVYERIKKYYGEGPLLNHQFCRLESIPTYMHNMIQGAYKVEYLLSGAYHVDSSKKYDELVPDVKSFGQVARAQKMSPKFLDTMRMNNYRLAMLMWQESLYSPGKIVKVKNCILDGNTPRWAVIRMQSHIVNCSNIISITNISLVDI